MAYTYTTSKYNTPSANTTHNVPLPGSLAGRRVIILFNSVASTVTTPSGWTLFAVITTSGRIVNGYYRDCDGSEGSTRSFTTGSSIVAAAVVIAFGAGEAASTAPQVGVAATGRDPPSISPAWGTANNTLFIALESAGAVGLTVSSYPTGYTDFQQAVNAISTIPMLIVCGKTAKVASDNPSTFTNSDTFTTSANTLAVKLNDLALSLPQTTRFDNTQTFYAPTVTQSRKALPSFFTNLQTFYNPKISVVYKPTARFDNAQTFYAPTVKSVLKLTAPLYTNVQIFYGPKIKATVKPSLFTNAQAFYGPKLKFVYKASLHTNSQVFYGPTVIRTQKVQPSLHTNPQSFYGPTVVRLLKVQPSLHTNSQVFYPPTVKITQKVLAPFHTNVQEFASGATPGWDVSGSWVLDTELNTSHYVTPLTLVQDSAGNLTGVGGSAPYTWTVNSGYVSGTTFEFWATYDSLVIAQHHIGTIAPDGTISGTWNDDYQGGRTGTFATTTGAAIYTADDSHKILQTYKASRFDNVQEFYSPSIVFAAVPGFVQPPFYTNPQSFYSPTVVVTPLALTVSPGFHINLQEFYGPSVIISTGPQPPVVIGGGDYGVGKVYKKRKKLIFPYVERVEAKPLPKKRVKPTLPVEEVRELRESSYPQHNVTTPRYDSKEPLEELHRLEAAYALLKREGLAAESSAKEILFTEAQRLFTEEQNAEEELVVATLLRVIYMSDS